MTCVSLRSGMASSGRCIMDQAPQVQAAATSAKTRYLFLTENSMIRLIIRASVRAQNLCEVAYLRRAFRRVRLVRVERPFENSVTHGYGGLVRIMRFRGRGQHGGAHAAFRINQEIS